MTLPAEHLRYPRRRRGMDHERYDWTPILARPPVAWPGGARLALWVVVALQWFPLDMPAAPIRPAGAVDEPYPDYRNYSHRDYGNRVGVFRVMAALDRLGLRATAAVNAAVCVRYPFVVREVTRRGWELAAHGVDMGRLHHGGLGEAEEAALVDQALGPVRAAAGGRPVRGWLSPAGSESARTPDLLAARGVEYVCDWVNDDLPYSLRTTRGPLYAMPYGHDWSDVTLIWQAHHTAGEWAEQVEDRFDALYGEAERHGGRVLALALHPWCIGQPHRIAALERVLAHVLARPGVWPATGGELLDAFREQEA
jgi:peptidoglycan/xylan/chitin deacetylase (PgdA/CDA1 family)